MAIRLSLILALFMLTTLSGCVRRTITIKSDPPGALVWLNDREVGRTPVDVEFLYYGTYDVRLVKDGYEPLMTSGKADAPLWDVVGFDLVSELLPMDLHSQIEWNYDLEPLIDDEAGLIERAKDLRSKVPEDREMGSQDQPVESSGS
ncbi:MAG: PEGA domain-containing protein [Planctomycetota bacterium]|nr:PEGA domain-containing protein [Planctomycetota bacterium]